MLAKAYNTCIYSAATTSALFMSQTDRLSLRPQTDLWPTSQTPPWSAV